jgi:S-adenosylmethionine:tRNA ribosyltransferase-isomerase
MGTFGEDCAAKYSFTRAEQDAFATASVQRAQAATAARQLNLAKKEGRAIIAVGTTVARALESATKNGAIKAGKSSTKIFIRPGYRWQMVDGLITNFHVPYSSLLMLVASLIGERKWKRLYRLALRSGYRFLSFGDGMFIQPVI